VIWRDGDCNFATASQSFSAFLYPKIKRARSVRSISYGLMHLIPSPMQASGIFIFLVEVEATSCVTAVCPYASE